MCFTVAFRPFKNVVKTVTKCKKWQKTTFGCRGVHTSKKAWAIFVGIYRCLVTWRQECMHFYVIPATWVAECMHFYVIPATWVAQCMHFYVIPATFCDAPVTCKMASQLRVSEHTCFTVAFRPFKNVIKIVTKCKK